jgi:hypothetical protein
MCNIDGKIIMYLEDHQDVRTYFRQKKVKSY